jgi:RNA polymerase sigma-70 factor, ECF subfamily
MSTPALKLVTPHPASIATPRGTVSRKSVRGTGGVTLETAVTGDPVLVAREEERGFVLAAQDGDTSAFAQLVRRHQQRAYAVARAVLLSHEDAEDAVQEGFLHAHRALSRFRPDQPFGAWLHRIISNAALDLARRRKVRDTDELVDTHASPFKDPAEADELHDRLRSALSQLPDRQRSVLVLHDVEGYKHAEIGAMLGIPEGTARSDLHHARAAMRTILGSLRRPA